MNYHVYFLMGMCLLIVGCATPNQNALFHSAIRRGDLDLVKRMSTKDTALLTAPLGSIQDRPIHTASKHGKRDIVEYLIINEVDVNVKNSEGKTPLDYAVAKQDVAISVMLKSPVKIILAEKTKIVPVSQMVELQEAVVLPLAVIGNFSENHKHIIYNNFLNKLSKYYLLIPDKKLKEAREYVFESVDTDECSEAQCIRKIQEILQVENVFTLQMIKEQENTQLSVSLVRLDDRIVKNDYCVNCSIRDLNMSIEKLVDILVDSI
ncbi:MAG: ankyrin repeat domain-containing protein [SAR324 cluster bacterium]|nr:ankyrin repeat domain-containing protein [SAR324 cluster bacterium]